MLLQVFRCGKFNRDALLRGNLGERHSRFEFGDGAQNVWRCLMCVKKDAKDRGRRKWVTGRRHRRRGDEFASPNW